MYGQTYFKWCHYFLFMLAGSICGLKMKEKGIGQHSTSGNLLLLFVSLMLFYGLQFVGSKNQTIAHFQILTLLPLMAITLCLYHLCNAPGLIRFYQRKWAHRIMYSVSALCLEIYVCQGFVFNTSWNNWFPFNILVNFILVVVLAYCVKVASNWFSQTFKDADYDWKKMIKL